MIVTGRVLDPAGKLMTGVPVDLIGRLRHPWVVARDRRDYHAVLGRGTTDGDGRFHLEATRTSADSFFDVHALATAPGFGLGWVAVDPDARQPSAEIRLRHERVVRGKLVSFNGGARGGVELRVWSVGRTASRTVRLYDCVFIDSLQPPEGLRTLAAACHHLTIKGDSR